MADKADFFTTFKARVKLATEAVKEQVQNELKDLRFEAGEHWDPVILQLRGIDRPAITIDLLSGPIKQVTNQQRTARPGIKISPVGDGADEEQAERWQGVVRRVERLSSAHRVYSWAGQYQVKMGRGFWVIRNVEVGDDGEQDIRLEEVENQHTILVDPTTKKLDGSDKKWAIRYEDVLREDYIDRFGESKLAGTLSDGHLVPPGASVPDWFTAQYVRIAEYYYLEEQARVRLVFRDRPSLWEDELPTKPGRVKGKFAQIPVLPDGAEVVKRVTKKKKTVHWCLINGIGEKLDSTTIPGEFIPVVMIYGERRMVDGARDFRGMVRMAIEPSRMEDFCESSLMEAISDAKTAPWMAEEEQIAEYEGAWTSVRPPKVLKYKRADINGHPIPPPQRVSSGVDVTALTLAAQRMQNHVRNVTGSQDTYQEETASLQSKLSGRAMRERKQDQELGTSDYMENLGDGIVLTAKIIMSMARDGVYDTPRLMRIIGQDEKELEIITHAGQGEEQQAAIQQLQQNRKAIAGMLDVSVGEYDITISATRNADTARREAIDAIASLPEEIIKVGADIYVGMMDFKGASEFAKRLKKLNPAAQDEQEQVPPQVQQRLEQLDQFAQMATEQINTLKDQLADKHDEMASKEKISAKDNAVKLEIEQMKIAADLELARIKGDLEIRKAEIQAAEAEKQRQADRDAMIHGSAHDRAMAAEGHVHAQEDAERGHAHAIEELKAKPKPNGAEA